MFLIIFGCALGPQENENGKQPTHFSKDVCYFWNSTFKLLNQSIDYKNLLFSFAPQPFPNSHLLPTTWNICKKLERF